MASNSGKPNAEPANSSSTDKSTANSLGRKAYFEPTLTRIMVAEATETQQRKAQDGVLGKGS